MDGRGSGSRKDGLMDNSFMWLVAYGRPAIGERLKSKGMVGAPSMPCSNYFSIIMTLTE